MLRWFPISLTSVGSGVSCLAVIQSQYYGQGSKPSLLKVWSTGQQRMHHLGGVGRDKKKNAAVLRQQAPSAHSPVRPAAQSPKGELAEDHMSPRISLEARLHIKGFIKGQLHKPNGNPVSKIKASIIQCFLKLICAGCHEVSVGMTLMSIINSFIWLLCLRASSITINLMVSN